MPPYPFCQDVDQPFAQHLTWHARHEKLEEFERDFAPLLAHVFVDDADVALGEVVHGFELGLERDDGLLDVAEERLHPG